MPGLPHRWQWRDTRNYSLAVLREPVDRVRLDLITGRGVRLTRTLSLVGQIENLNTQARHDCGFALPAEAFGDPAVHVSRIRRGVAVTLTMANRSVLPLSLTSLAAPPGMTMSEVSPPVALPPGRLPAPGHTATSSPYGPQVRVRNVLRISDCTTFLLDGSLMSRAALDGVVTGPTGNNAMAIPLDGSAWDPDAEQPSFGAFYELARDCDRRSG